MAVKSVLTVLQLLLASFTCASPVSLFSGPLPRDVKIVRPANKESYARAPAVKYLFSFGSSYTQTGFSITGTKPSANNPLGNPAYPGYTSTGGENWVDFLLTKYNTSLTLGYNFGYGGATTNRSVVPPTSATTLTLVDEVAIFKQNLASHPGWAPWTAQDSLFAIWMSGNDVANSWQTGVDIETVFPQVVKSIIGQARVLLDAGARKFVFLTVPRVKECFVADSSIAIQRTPLNLSNGVNTTKLENVVARSNSILKNYFNSFSNAHTEAQVFLVDVQPLFKQILDNPTAYGAPNSTCFNSDGVSCLWWNNYHPGITIHKLVAQLISQELKGVYF